MPLTTLVLCVIAALALTGEARAATPTLQGVGHQDRHPTASFSAPGADGLTVYMASKPDRATDGRFLSENIVDLDFLTDDEIQSGRWLSASQLDPGRYFVMLSADDYDCSDSPMACMDGFSNMAELAVPVPAQTYQRKVTTSRYSSRVDLDFTVTPLGTELPYRVCWSPKRARRKCVNGTVGGYDWNESATDSLSVRKRGMRRTTTFSWYVAGHKVTSRRARIR